MEHKNEIKTYKVELSVISPIIINSGEVFDLCEIYPTGIEKFFKGDVDFELPKAYVFQQNNLMKIFNSLSSNESKRFINASTNALLMKNKKGSESLNVLRNELMAKVDHKERIIVPGRMLENAYMDLRDRPLMQINKVMQEKSNAYVYIPGSSIKGAIRTTILERRRNDRRIEAIHNSRFPDYENLISTGTVDLDPFKYIKVSDFTFKGTDAIQYIGKINNGTSIPIYSAMTSCYMFVGKEVKAYGTISIDSQFFQKTEYDGKRFSFDSLLKTISDYYIDILEQSNYKALLKNKFAKVTLEELGKAYSRTPNSAIIRLGHYCGIQSKSLKVENPAYRQKTSINIDGTNKISLIEDKYVPGFGLLEFKGEI